MWRDGYQWGVGAQMSGPSLYTSAPALRTFGTPPGEAMFNLDIRVESGLARRLGRSAIPKTSEVL